MKTILKYSLLILSVVILSTNFASAQRGKKADKNDAKTQKPVKNSNYVEPEVIIISAVERGPGVYRIFIDAGTDREGNANKLASTEREEEALANLVNNNSIPNLLSVLFKRGYELISVYAFKDKEITHYYILSKALTDDLQFENQKRQQARSNQNKPQMSPEEVEKRKRMREQNKK